MEATSGTRPLFGQPALPAGAGRGRAAPRAAPAIGAGHAADWPRTTRFLPWALFAFIAMVWLVPFDSVDLPAGLPVDVTLDRPLLVLIAAAWLLAATAAAVRRPARRSPIHWAFGTFTALAIISVLANGEDLVRVDGIELAIKQLALLISYAVFFVLAASIIRPAEASKMAAGMVVLACVTAVALIVEYRFGTNVFHDWIGPLFPGYVRPPGLDTVDSIGRKQIFGPTIQPLAASVMVSLALPFALTWLLGARRNRERLLGAAVVLLLIGGAMATQKKTSLIAPATAVLVLTLYRPRPMLRLLPLLAVVMIGVVHLVAPGALGGVIDQFSPNSVTKVNTTRDRASDYEAITPDLAAHPLIGRGYGSYDQKYHRILDNEYLGLGIGVGLLGLLAYLSIFATAFLSAHRVARSGDPERAPPAMGAATAIVVALLAGALLDFLSFPQLPYLLCFVAAIAHVLAREQQGVEPA